RPHFAARWHGSAERRSASAGCSVIREDQAAHMGWPSFVDWKVGKGSRAGQTERKSGGGGEIRTLGRLSPTPVFKTGAINRSATPPRDGECYLNIAGSQPKAHPG